MSEPDEAAREEAERLAREEEARLKVNKFLTKRFQFFSNKAEIFLVL